MTEFKIDDEYTYRICDDSNNGWGWDVYRFEEKIPSTCPTLYKFYNLNLYSIDALLRSYFYLANPSTFNDPFDCNLNLINLARYTDKSKSIRMNHIEGLGVSCLTETLDNHLMWAHYANNYNGFCLEFAGDNLDIKVPKGEKRIMTLTKVIYPAAPVRVDAKFPFANRYLLTTKFKHWEYEKEWRIVSALKGSDRELEYFPNCVKALYIGHNVFDTTFNLYNMLLEVHEIKFPNIPIYVVYPNPLDLQLTIEKVYP